MTLKKAFGSYVKLLRKSLNLSQDSLAKEIGVTRQTIGNIESGTHLPKAEIVEDIYKLFKNNDVLFKYLDVQRNKSDLLYLSERLVRYDCIIAQRVMKIILRNSIEKNDLNTAASVVFQSIMSDILHQKKINHRKVQYVIGIFKVLDSEHFIDLLFSLYQISFQQNKQFEAYVTILENVMEYVSIGNERSFILWYNYANALYYQGKFLEAFDASSEGFRHNYENIKSGQLAKVYSRRGLISLQLKGYSTALISFEKCLELANEEIKKYCFLNIGRTYYMWGKSEQAIIYWNKFLAVTNASDPLRINVFNDMCMNYLMENNLKMAQDCHRKAGDLFKTINSDDWHMYDAEHLLYRRNEAFMLMHTDSMRGYKEVLSVINELKRSHLQDELDLTRNFLVETQMG